MDPRLEISEPKVFEYDDYHRFLKDFYEFQKRRKASFSFRSFASKAGLNSPNYLKLVMEGQRRLGNSALPKFIKALGLKNDAAEYFEALVFFNNASLSVDKQYYFEKMTQFRKFREIRQVEKDSYEFYSHWFYSAVRELINLEQFCEDPTWIAKQLHPEISEHQASEALKLLERLGFVVREASSGKLVQSTSLISTGAEVQSISVAKFHREMMSLAEKSIDETPSEERNLSGVTIGVDQSQLESLREKIFQFRQELLSEIKNAETVDRVYQLNIQFFPLSKEKEAT